VGDLQNLNIKPGLGQKADGRLFQMAAIKKLKLCRMIFVGNF